MDIIAKLNLVSSILKDVLKQAPDSVYITSDQVCEKDKKIEEVLEIVIDIMDEMKK
jgi:hypothetical protein